VIRVSDKNALFDPDKGSAYSSVGYIFLGLVLANLTGSATYKDYDQASVLPAHIRPRFKNTRFPLSGLCKDYATASMFALGSPSASLSLPCRDPDSLRQVKAADVVGKLVDYKCDLQYGTDDARDFSCTNGWTMGNIITTASEAAQFVYELYGPTPSIVTAATQKMMLGMKAFTQGWGAGSMYYGMGVYMKSLSSAPPSDAAWMYGHGGADYGSYTNAHYNPLMQFALVVSTTNESALTYNAEHYSRGGYPSYAYANTTTSFAFPSISNPHAEDTWCAVVNAVLEALSSVPGALPAINRENASAQWGGWAPANLMLPNSCYYCRLCEGMPEVSHTDPNRRRRRTYNEDNDDDRR